jgi:hypothetical protein
MALIDRMNEVKEPKYPKSIFPFKNLKCLVHSNNTGKSFYLQDNEVKEGELEISVKSFKQNVQDFKIPIGSWIFLQITTP